MIPTQPTPKLRIKTELQEEREARDLAIYNEFHALVANPEQSKKTAVEFLMAKYGIHSAGTIYVILKRVQNLKNNEK